MDWTNTAFNNPRARRALERIDRNHDKAQRRIADATGDHFAGRLELYRDRVAKVRRVERWAEREHLGQKLVQG